MKILAIETELRPINSEKDKAVLKEEALAVYQLQQQNILREIWFTENRCAVLILECESKNAAIKLLEELPLVKKRFIKFEISELRPYTGFSCLFQL